MSTKEKARWRDPALGTARELNLSGGKIRCFEAGSGAPIVFVHGFLVNPNLWRKVVARLSPDFRCIALELPLGGHELPMPAGADLSPVGLAGLVAEALEALDLDDVTLVGNDTGGAVCQVVVTRHPERIGRLVLTSCDYRDNFPPAVFNYLKLAVRVPGAVKALLMPLRLRAARRLPIAFGWVTKRPIDRQAEDSYVLPSLVLPGIERDVKEVVRGLDKRYTNEAADRLGSFDRPALLAWSREDKLFPAEDAEGLARDLPNARLEWVEDSLTFSPEDNPGRLTELIAGFVREPVAAQG